VVRESERGLFEGVNVAGNKRLDFAFGEIEIDKQIEKEEDQKVRNVK
jgi:hypothetical protein